MCAFTPVHCRDPIGRSTWHVTRGSAPPDRGPTVADAPGSGTMTLGEAPHFNTRSQVQP